MPALRHVRAPAEDVDGQGAKARIAGTGAQPNQLQFQTFILTFIKNQLTVAKLTELQSSESQRSGERANGLSSTFSISGGET
jgi:hypothetical protein